MKIQKEHSWKKLGGNADGCEKKGVAGTATQKMLKTKELEIDASRKTHRVAVEGGDETGTLSAEPRARDYRIRYCLSSEKLNGVD